MLTTDRESMIRDLDTRADGAPSGSFCACLRGLAVNREDLRTEVGTAQQLCDACYALARPRLTHVCLICKRRDDMGPSVTGEAAVSHGLDHPGNEACVSEYRRLYCGGVTC